MDQNDTNDKDKAVGDSGAISSDLIRGHINTIILRTLYDGDKYGYEIISEIEEKSRGQYALKQPTLYSALKRLESQDYVTSYWGGVSNGGRRKYFQITDKGRKVVEQNLAEWEYSRTVIDSLISEKDYDFTNPPPASNVDFSLLKRSTSRVPVMKGEDEADDIELAEAGDTSLTGTVETTEMMGSSVYLHVNVDGKDSIIILQNVEEDGRRPSDIQVGSMLSFTFSGSSMHLFDRESALNLEC